MKAYICDQCGKHEQTDYNGLKPRGWFGLDRRNPTGGGHSIDLELCSPECLAAKAVTFAPVPEADVAPEESQPEPDHGTIVFEVGRG